MFFSSITEADFFLRYVAARRFRYVIFGVATARCRTGERAFRFMVYGLRSQALVIYVVVFREGARYFRLISGTFCFYVGLLRRFVVLVGEGSGCLGEDRVQ